MIKSFGDKDSEDFYQGQRIAKFQAFEKILSRKIDQLDAATTVSDLRIPNGNRLKKLEGDKNHLWSIRINDQWRIVFEWPENSPGPENVCIIDYH